jgi:molybdopterin molybdotransferase
MLSVAEAQAIVHQHVRPLPAERTPLTPAALGLVLAEDIASDLDMPPFDKAMMDGYAVRAADLGGSQAVLQVLGEITAGQVPEGAVGAGEAIRVMTGAPIPAGADAVVMVERTRLLDDGRVQIDDGATPPGQNIFPRAREMRRGERVLAAGAELRPQEFGLLATVGRSMVLVHPRPRVALLATGNELVDASATPGPGQIRNGNGPMLLAQVSRAGGTPRFLGIARDDSHHLATLIGEGLRSEVLVLSGGVSAGKLDLVPGVLQEQGVTAHFHKVAMKPGKPVLFGTRGATLVFGLPGNPVSALVCFELFVRPALRRLQGHADAGPPVVPAILSNEFAYKTDRPTYHPARLEAGPAGWRVTLIPWSGSPDLRALCGANALALLEVGTHRYEPGQSLPVIVMDH